MGNGLSRSSDLEKASIAARKAMSDRSALHAPNASLPLALRRAPSSEHLNPAGVRSLQRSAGNLAVARLMIQAKLTVGPADDAYEREADHVADQVMNMAGPAGSRAGAEGGVQRTDEDEIQAKPLVDSISRLVVQREASPEEEELPVQGKRLQRQEVEDEIQAMRLQREASPEEEELPVQSKRLQREASPEEEELPVQGKRLQREASPEEEELPVQGKRLQREASPEEEELPVQGKRLQREQDFSGSFDAGKDVEDKLQSEQGSGSQLPAETRAFFEPRFGADLGSVRVHTDSTAADLNRSVAAQAFTHGKDIYFGEGKYDPSSDGGRHLLAHELTHVFQQTGNNQSPKNCNGLRDAQRTS